MYALVMNLEGPFESQESTTLVPGARVRLRLGAESHNPLLDPESVYVVGLSTVTTRAHEGLLCQRNSRTRQSV